MLHDSNAILVRDRLNVKAIQLGNTDWQGLRVRASLHVPSLSCTGFLSFSSRHRRIEHCPHSIHNKLGLCFTTKKLDVETI
jgi:hypothetical protein